MRVNMAQRCIQMYVLNLTESFFFSFSENIAIIIDQHSADTDIQ